MKSALIIVVYYTITRSANYRIIFLFLRSKNEFYFVKKKIEGGFFYAYFNVDNCNACTSSKLIINIGNHYGENRVSYKLFLQLSNDHLDIIRFDKY